MGNDGRETAGQGPIYTEPEIRPGAAPAKSGSESCKALQERGLVLAVDLDLGADGGFLEDVVDFGAGDADAAVAGGVGLDEGVDAGAVQRDAGRSFRK